MIVNFYWMLIIILQMALCSKLVCHTASQINLPYLPLQRGSDIRHVCAFIVILSAFNMQTINTKGSKQQY